MKRDKSTQPRQRRAPSGATLAALVISTAPPCLSSCDDTQEPSSPSATSAGGIIEERPVPDSGVESDANSLVDAAGETDAMSDADVTNDAATTLDADAQSHDGGALDAEAPPMSRRRTKQPAHMLRALLGSDAGASIIDQPDLAGCPHCLYGVPLEPDRAPGVPQIGSMGRIAQPTARVRLSQISTQGALDSSEATRQLRRHLGIIRRCYERELRQHPDIRGWLEVHLRVTATGQVQSIRVSRTSLDSQAIESCLRSSLQRIRFPETPGRLSFRLELAPPRR